jgi:hypothetical protein
MSWGWLAEFLLEVKGIFWVQTTRTHRGGYFFNTGDSLAAVNSINL